MWNSTQSAGFMNSSMSSPSAAGSDPSSGGKAKRAQNVVPVKIEELLSAPEEGFKIEGMEVGVVCVLGQITNVESATTKTTYQIEDNTGSVEAVQWVEDGSPEPAFKPGTYIRVYGSMRTQGEKKHLMGFRVLEAPSQAERDNHELQVVFSHMKLKLINAKLAGGQTGTMDNSGLSNSMMGSGMGGANFGGGGSTFTSSFGNKTYDTVYGLIKQCHDDQGINISSILSSVQGKMSKSEMDGAIEFLSNEGHIYSTVDDEHFKSTDGD